MAATRPTIQGTLVGLFVLTGLGLAALGFVRDAWWPLAGATGALAAAAWIATEEDDG
ncbi:MAG: hypothetical protein KC656_28345 [Myxococcales bacterium]|nr:hypothetical protein [Myxococcales bacterium]MCB9662697.1 hypothetical protein [Alphaproteobacteria bacterium]